MTRVALVTAAFVAAVAVWGLALPPRRIQLAASWDDGTVPGLLHVHSRASDGRGTLDEIAAAAARAGLKFVVVTDHGDGTRRPEPPAYRSGVLLLDGVEISTRGGHYIAVGLPESPYPLGGDPADVVEDVRRLGGFGIAAHPDSPKPELQWTDWTAPVDAVELINPDSSWRAHAYTGGVRAKWLLLRALLAYPVRPAEAIGDLLTDSGTLRERWLTLAAERPVVGLAGADAHAKLALRDTEAGDNRFSIPIPSYESSFESLSVHVMPEQPFSGDAPADARALLGGLRGGRLYLAVNGWASPPAFTFTATTPTSAADEGQALIAGSPVTLHIRSNAPAGYRTIVWDARQPIAERTDTSFDLPAGDMPAVYSVTIMRDGNASAPPWITSNPVYVRAASGVGVAPPSRPPLAEGPLLFDGRSMSGWSYESDKTSLAVVDLEPLVTGARVRLRFGLSGGATIGQYAAAAVETSHGVADAVAFSVRAETPMRISVQVRADVSDGSPERWEHSVFVDANERERRVRFADMTPVGRTHAARPPAPDVRAIMFVVDTTNTKPGSSGRLWIGNVRLAAAR